MDKTKVLKDFEAEETKLTKHLERAKAMRRLIANDDYKEVIENFYLKEFASIQAKLLTMVEDPQKITEELIAISRFNNFVETVLALGIKAEDDLPRLAEAKIDILNGKYDEVE